MNKRNPKKSKDVEESEIYFPPIEEIETVNGEMVQIPKLAWGREIRVLQSFSSLLGKLPDDVFEDFSLRKLPTVFKTISQEKFFDDLTQCTAQILGKEKNWIENNLDSTAILRVVLPFFGERMKKWANLTQGAAGLQQLQKF